MKSQSHTAAQLDQALGCAEMSALEVAEWLDLEGWPATADAEKWIEMSYPAPSFYVGTVPQIPHEGI